MGGGHTAATSESVVNGSTSAATSAPAQTGATDTTLASDFNHISAADAARFDEASGRLQGELDAIVTCIREDDPGCVNGERDGFRAAFWPAPSSPGCSGGSHRRDLKRNARDYLFAGADGLAEKALISPITAVKRVNAVAAIEAVVTRRAP